MDLKLAEFFYDKRKRYVYYNHKTEKAYRVNDKDYKKFNAFHNRFIVALTLGVMLPIVFDLEITFIPIIFIVAYIALDLYFKKSILPKLEEIPNYNYAKSIVEKKKNPIPLDILKTILYIVASVMIIYLTLNDEYEMLESTIMILFGIFSFILGIKSLYDVIKRIRN